MFKRWSTRVGAIKIGAVPIPLNTMLIPDDYEYYLNDRRARVLVVSEELYPLIKAIKGDLPYLRDLIIISETEGAHVPFKQKYKHAPSELKSAFWNPSSLRTDGIGSTEVLHIFCSNRPGAIKPGSAGKPVPGYELKIVDEEGKEVPQGQIGTLLVKGESIAQQY